MSSSDPAMCIEIDEFVKRVDAIQQVKEDPQSFSVSHLHHLHKLCFNSKVTEMKEAADLFILTEYSK